jgi:nucleotide-binding universal stress UspA family protein
MARKVIGLLNRLDHRAVTRRRGLPPVAPPAERGTNGSPGGRRAGETLVGGCRPAGKRDPRDREVHTTGSALNAVVGFDGSSSGERALEWAAEEAGRRSIRLHIIHVWQPPPILATGFAVPTMPDSEMVLQDALLRAAKVAPDVRVSTRAMPGAVASALIDASVEADTVVVGVRAHRRAGYRDFGSTVWQVAQHALCPVVVVRDLSDGPPRRTVVAGVDGSLGCERALDYAFSRASSGGLEITAVHGWHLDVFESHGELPSGAAIEAREHAQLAQLASWVGPFAARYPDVRVHTQALRHPPAQAILQQASGAQLVVVGSRGRGEIRGPLLGSVGMDLLRRAPCPVAIVRH